MIDTHADLIESLNYTITAAGLTPVTYDDLTHLVGQGARVMIRRAFDLRNTPLSETDLEPLFERFIDHYRKGIPGKSRPYPGLLACFERLKASGMTIAVCTNKQEVLALPLLEGLGLTHHFAAITGGDTFAFRKPDARHIFGTIERAGGDPDRSVMIGDSVNDILAAHNANIPSIGVSFGYSDVPVAELNPSVVIDGFDELTVDLVNKLLAPSVA
ncbi:HAD family hydrolase [Neorhizobium sp. NPDC001467]|uniref:HAD family hydrolase n=1 Tax=Neorhizobium sp. NPDC001467 TaxID=3390595 RepID=UPI003D06EEC2